MTKRTIALWMGSAAGLLAVAATASAWTGTGYVYDTPAPAAVEPSPPDAGGPTPAVLRTRLRSLEARLARTRPRRAYIVIDRTHNQLSLRNGDQTPLLAVCSAGSGAVLAEPGGARRWTFSTPRGRFEVISKIRNPVWKKPDWGFIEEGQPIPTDEGERFEYGVLGEYALYFGDGYMIHGTLYERLLGRSVSHGCIRLGRDDLRALYAASRPGTPIYIY
jgi:L,D-transpeptidase YbiS